MGISNFFSYVSNVKDLKKSYKLRDTSVVIDGSNVFFLLYQKYNTTTRGIDFKLGGNYIGYDKYCRHFFDQLKKCGISAMVQMDGINKYSSSDFDKRIHNLKNLHRYESLRPLLLEDIFESVVKDLKLDYLRTIYDSDPDLAKLANQLKSPVISSDSDFYCFNVEEGVISFDDLDWTELKQSDESDGNYYIDCKRFRFEDLANKLPGLTPNMMHIFASLFSNDFTLLYDVFQDFLKSIVDGSSDKRMISGWNKSNYKRFNKSIQRMERMDRFLKWLSHLNGDPNFAINRLKSYIDRQEMSDDKKQEVVTSLDNALAAYQCKEDNETYLKPILDLKKNVIEGNEESVKQILVAFEVLDNDCQGLPNHILYNFFVKDEISLWVFRLTNRSSTVELKQLVEDVTLGSINKSCLDLIKTISGLLRSDDQIEPIKVHLREENFNIACEEIIPATDYITKSGQKPLPKVSQFADQPQDERELIFLDLLAVNVEEFALPDNNKDDYEFWKYFVINAKYWSSKTNMDNKSCLINCLIISAIYYRHEDKIESEELKKLAEDAATEDDFELKITHYFNEFQVIYRFIDCLHSLLGYPIGRASLASSINGVLISRLAKRDDQILSESQELNELKNILNTLIVN